MYESATDASGNVYLTGFFANSVSFGSTILTAVGSDDVFIARWNKATGTFAWARRAGGTGNEYGYGIAVSGTSVYVSGIFDSPTATFGSTTLLNANAARTNDVFVAKLTDAGSSASWAWAKQAGNQSFGGNGEIWGLKANGNNVFVLGTFLNSSQGFGSTTFASAGAKDIFVTKLLDAGTSATTTWTQRAGGLNTEEGFALCLAPGTVYVAGYIRGNANFGTIALASPVGQSAGFLAALPDTTVLPTRAAAAAGLGLVVYPTPAHTVATVVLPATSPAGAAVMLTVLDALGRTVRTRTATPAPGTHHAELSVADLVPGAYTLRAAVADAVGTARLVVK